MAISGLSLLPNILSTDGEKDTPEFGRKFMQAAYDNWNSGYNGETRSGRQSRFDYNRLFGMGRQPMQEYKDILDLDGENSVIQLIYEPLPIAIPFVNRIKDRYNQRIEKISCNAIDPFTTEKKQTAKNNAKFKLNEKDKIQSLQQQAGVQIESYDDNDPQSEEEIEIEFGYNYKEREEVIMQELINIVFYDNDYTGVIKDRLLDDLIHCGYAGTKTYIDGSGRIKIRFIRPENLITSYTEWSDFRDWEYLGEVFYMNIAEIRLKYPGKIDEEDLFELSLSMVGKYGNPNDFSYDWNPMWSTALARPYDGFKVEVVELDVKTLYNLKYKTGLDKFGKETLDKVKKMPKGDNALVSNPYYVSYTGVMIADTEYLLEWQLSKDMVKPQDNLQEIISQFAVYMYGNQKMVNKPMMETMIPSIKKMQLIDLKQQNIIAAAMPDGYDVDISTMSDVDIGVGEGALNPFELYKIKKQTGIGFYKHLEDDGTGQRREPITANNVPFSGKLEQLRQEWNAEFDTLMKVTGDNNLNSGIITNQAVSQEVVKQASQTGQSASNYLYNAYLNITQRTAKLAQLRGWDILVFGKKGHNFYDGYRKALGTNKIEYLRVEATDDFEKTNFDTQIKAIIDDSEQAFLEQNIAACLTQKEITLSDAIDVRKLAIIDVDYASYMLSARIKRRQKEAAAQALANSKQNTEQQVEAAKAKSDGLMELEQLKHSNKMAEMAQEQNNSKETEILKSVGILKAEVAKGVLAEPGKSWTDIPKFVFEGIGIVDHTEDMLMVGAIHDQQDNLQAQQQQDAAQQQQGQQAPVEDGQQVPHMTVQLPDGRTGKIPHHKYNELKAKHPDAKILAA